MSSEMRFSKQFKSMFPSRTTSAPIKAAHIRTLPNGNELFVVYSTGSDGGIVTAWEEDQKGSSGTGSVPTSIGWGQPILMPAANVKDVGKTYYEGVMAGKNLIWLSPFVFNMFPFKGFKIVAVTKRKGRGYMIKEKSRKWFVPVVDGFELKDFGDKDIWMLMFKLEAMFGND